MSCDEDLFAALPWPAAEANKYTRGKLVVVAGSARYPGAAALAARAGQRMGAGYTEVVTAREAVDVVRIASPSSQTSLTSTSPPKTPLQRRHAFAP